MPVWLHQVDVDLPDSIEVSIIKRVVLSNQNLNAQIDDKLDVDGDTDPLLLSQLLKEVSEGTFKFDSDMKVSIVLDVLLRLIKKKKSPNIL